MTIKLPDELETRLKRAAAREGLPPDELASRLIDEALAVGEPDTATLDLFARWEAEDHTDDPEEIARRTREAEEFVQNLARNRIEMEGPDARKLWP